MKGTRGNLVMGVKAASPEGSVPYHQDTGTFLMAGSTNTFS